MNLFNKKITLSAGTADILAGRKNNAKIISVLCAAALLTLTACGTTSAAGEKSSAAAEKTKIDPAVQADMDKKVTAVTNIAKLMADENLEGAFYRMDANFRSENSLDSFSAQWKKITDENGKITDFTVDTSEFLNLSYYKTLKVVYKLEKADVTARYLFNSSVPFPMDVIFGNSGKIITDEEIPLKALCSSYFKLGCGITGFNTQTSALRVPAYMDIVKTQFSSCTSTNMMKPAYVLNQTLSQRNAQKGINEPGLDFSIITPTLEWCKENGVPVRGHTIAWHTQVPEWFFRDGFTNDGAYVSRESMIQRLDSFVKQYFGFVQENYPGVVYCWDMVNEAVDPDNGDETTDFMCRKENGGNPNGWYMTIGKDYPEVAFTIGRKYAADGVKLFYNDYGTVGQKKRQCIYNLCKSLKEKGLIDGIGMQSYWDVKNPTLKQIEEAINNYAELGLELQLTEWSIPAKTETAEGFAEQAERYAAIFKLLQRLDTQGGGKANITCVSFFGVQDKYKLYQNDTNNTRLYDTNLQKKTAWYAVSDIMKLYY